VLASAGRIPYGPAISVRHGPTPQGKWLYRWTMDEAPRMLLVEDLSPRLEALAAVLQSRGYVVDSESTESGALEAVVRVQPDLMLLDLSTGTGLDHAFCRSVRSQFDVPIIAMASMEMRAEVPAVLEAGASSFVTRPLIIDELILRIRAVLETSKRPIDVAPESYEAGPLIIYPARRQVLVRGQRVALQRLEYELLVALASRPGRLLFRRELVDLLWPDRQDGPNNLRNLINRVRQKIEIDPYRPRHVLTVRHVGYYFELSPSIEGTHIETAGLATAVP